MIFGLVFVLNAIGVCVALIESDSQTDSQFVLNPNEKLFSFHCVFLHSNSI